MKQVRSIMKGDMKMSFVKSKKLHPNSNSGKVMIQRQQYAMTMINLLIQGKRIINIDETWLNETSFVRRVWAPRDGNGNVDLRTITPRVSVIAALDTNGKVWFTLSHSNTDSNIMALFFTHLVQALDHDQADWRDNTVILLDNATYHWDQDTKEVLYRLGLQIIYSGAYSFSAAPVETLFSHLKSCELNVDQVPTGKR